MPQKEYLEGKFPRGTKVTIDFGDTVQAGYYYGVSPFGSSHVVTTRKCMGMKPAGGRWRIPIDEGVRITKGHPVDVPVIGD